MDKKMVLVALLTLSITLFAPNTLAQQTSQTCLDSSLLQINSTIDFTIDGNQSTLQTSETINCPFGCSDDTNECKPAPFKENVMAFGLVMGMMIIAGVMYALSISFGMFALFIVTVMAILVGAMDIFSSSWQIMFFLVALLNLVAGLFVFRRNQKKEDDLEVIG